MYGKLFAQMYDGSLYGKWQALVTFQQMIVLADVEGVVDMTPQALAARTSIPLEIIQQGLTDLEQPDPDSRTPGEEGRRIVRLSDTRSWGWRLTNYEHYRQIRSTEERREYMREYMRDRRLDAVNTPLAGVSNVSPSRSRSRSSKDTSDSDAYSPEFEKVWQVYPSRPNNSKAAAWRQWKARLRDGEDSAQILAGTLAYAALVTAEQTEPRFVKMAATFFGRDRHYLSDFTPAASGPPPGLQDEPDLEWVTAENHGHVGPR